MVKTKKTSHGKEEEIAQLFSQGTSAVDLVRLGFARGTVYKVAKRLLGQSTPLPGTPATKIPDLRIAPEIEGDPEIVELKKVIRKAELERQLAELNGSTGLDEHVKSLEKALGVLAEQTETLQVVVDASPLSGLGLEYKCTCGAEGMVASKIECTACGKETSYGWFSKERK